MNHIGNRTQQETFLNIESHKLHLAFTAEGDIKKAQPVKINADGTVSPLAAADASYLKIGDAIHSKKDGEEVTILMRGHARVTVEAGGVLDAGPVKWSAYNEPTGRNRYVAAADAATSQGFSIMPATAAGQEIEVVLF